MADLNTNSEQTVDNAEVTTPQEAENQSTQQEPEVPAEPTYTKKELESRISAAVNAALDKQRKNQAKSNDDLAQELADLRIELARKDNESYVANEVNARNIPSELTPLFYAEDSDASKAKLDAFTKWFKTAVDKAVEAKLNATPAPTFNPSEFGGKNQTIASMGFLEFYQNKQNSLKKL